MRCGLALGEKNTAALSLRNLSYQDILGSLVYHPHIMSSALLINPFIYFRESSVCAQIMSIAHADCTDVSGFERASF